MKPLRNRPVIISRLCPPDSVPGGWGLGTPRPRFPGRRGLGVPRPQPPLCENIGKLFPTRFLVPILCLQLANPDIAEPDGVSVVLQAERSLWSMSRIGADGPPGDLPNDLGVILNEDAVHECRHMRR